MAHLTEVIERVWNASIPLAERRRLCRGAVTAAALAPQAPPRRADHLERLECVLAAAAESMGQDKLSITAVKDALRANGRQDLAARLSKLSKARNAEAHPDVALADHVRGALQGGT